MGDPPLFLGGGGAPPQEHYSYTGAAPRPPRRSQAPPPPHPPITHHCHPQTGTRPSPPLQHRQPPQDDSPTAGSGGACGGLSSAAPAAGTFGGQACTSGRHLRRAVLAGACAWRSPAAPAAGRLRQRLRRAGEPTYRTAAAGEPTYRTAAGGAFGGRVRWRRRDSLPAVAAAAGGRGLGEAGARAWRGGRAAAAVGLSGVVSTVGRRAR